MDSDQVQLTLASGSPRRRELLRGAGVEVQVVPVEVDETPGDREPPHELAARLAAEKARAAERASQQTLILGADTVVVHRGQILGKPANRQEAADMLSDLRAGQHEVLTGLALLDRAAGRIVQDVVLSRVPMRDYGTGEIAEYISGGSPLDKAGGYGIQDADFQPVDLDLFEDCFTNVMGLPLCCLELLYRQIGAHTPADFVGACFSFHPHNLPWSRHE